jgi:hypothetical protein
MVSLCPTQLFPRLLTMMTILCSIPLDPRCVDKVAMLVGLVALASLGACDSSGGEPPKASTAADAQGSDAAYCAELGRLALRYTGHAGGNGGLAPDYTTLDALDDCRKGNTARGISILEKKLRYNGFTLPKR